MLPIGLFETSCTYMRLISLVMGFILFLAALFVMIRPLSKNKSFDDEDKRTRAVNLYLKSQQDQKSHLFWMLVICAVIVWYIGVLIPSSYLSNLAVQKSSECAGTLDARTYSSYNIEILLPAILFLIGVVFNVIGATRHADSGRVFHTISYLALLIATIWVVLIFRSTDICQIAAKCG
ncbi:MAG: hypothetical protein V1909_02140 [Candidatus Micrarchaeota archaeon]